MTDPLQRFRDAAAVRGFNGVTRALRPRQAAGDGLIDFASNDYLGLSKDPRVLSAAAAATLVWGAGSTGSRLVTGSTTLHADLEKELASFLHAPASLVFSSGYLANLGVLGALGGPDVLIVSDEGNHASIIDACRLSRSRVAVYAHRDLAAAERALALRDEPHAILVTDAVFSVDGDLAPVKELYAMTRRYGALLAVDEAHSLGVVGEGGRGAVHAAGLSGQPDVIRTVTLSKALGSQGGAVIADPLVIATLVDTARPFIFDTGLAPAATAAALTALRVLAASPDLAVQARARAAELAWLARQAGLTVNRPDAAVLSVTLGDPHSALSAQQVAAGAGIRVGCFRPPSVPENRSCLRLTARADLTEGQLSMAARAFHAVARSRGYSLPALPPSAAR
ncbi:MAG: 8-amino-7-oxononanoate synthase [Cryptosporangiaceae bacterium]|nr:8-amino-7-oxononanoate synthase [Cryptosporangiaceae bacterium]